VVKGNRIELSDQIDINIPNVARAYDFLLGGAHNFAADRKLAAMAETNMPHLRDAVRLNRTFLRRAVHFMIGLGIRQFLDLGSGIPTVGNVHEIAQAAEPECRVVYVDKNPMAVAHSRLLLEGNEKATAIQADIRDPDDILGRAETRELLNFDEPLGLLTLLVWHFVADPDDPMGLLVRYRDALVPGSYLALSHTATDHEATGLRNVVAELHRHGEDGTTPRPYKQIVAMFDGFELVEPGVVGCASWRPDGPGDFSELVEANRFICAGVGRKPETPGR
jgi:S-adenosyl methyltransferase